MNLTTDQLESDVTLVLTNGLAFRMDMTLREAIYCTFEMGGQLRQNLDTGNFIVIYNGKIWNHIIWTDDHHLTQENFQPREGSTTLKGFQIDYNDVDATISKDGKVVKTFESDFIPCGAIALDEAINYINTL